jgi:anionic cell wall polymer biosynthesis LytR-Cps2A-Psr (LCP) family protein
VLLTLSLVLVVLVAAIGGYAYYLNGRVHRITVLHFKPAPKKGADVGTENILMVGSTSRCALTVQNPAYGLCSQGVTGVNSDVIMVLHLNPSMRTASVLSIPRDLFIPNARETGANKIDAAPPSRRTSASRSSTTSSSTSTRSRTWSTRWAA